MTHINCKLLNNEVGANKEIASNLEPGNPFSASFPRNGKRAVFDQGNAPTCASTSCGMVLDTLGQSVDLNILAKQARVTSRGTNARNIVLALRANGVSTARVERGLTLDDLVNATSKGYPVIANVTVTRFATDGSFWARGGHAVVVDGVTTRQGQKMVAIRDPAGGRQFFTPAQEFIDLFTGEAILTNEL